MAAILPTFPEFETKIADSQAGGAFLSVMARRAAHGCALLPSRNSPAGPRSRDRVAVICNAGNPGVFRPK
jgi:hypothetical protein